MSRSRPIALITATPNGFNPGMLASQLSARWFLERCGLQDRTTFLRLVSLEDRLGSESGSHDQVCLSRLADGIRYELLKHPNQLAGTTPLYWGDLLHMRQYMDALRRLPRGPAVAVERLLLLPDAPDDVARRAVSFGTTFLYHSAADLIDAEFGPAFARFAARARLIMPRDMVSAAAIGLLHPRASFPLGLDVTQLLCGRAWREAFPDGIDRSLSRPNALLCHFARARHGIEDLNRVTQLFARMFAAPVYWLPWGDRRAFPHGSRYEGVLDVDTLQADAGRAPSLSALLEGVAQARCIITDTYHLAVIAWTLGTPALMVRGQYWPGDYNAIVDKRHVFFMQHGLQDFFVANVHDAGSLAHALERACELVDQGEVLSAHVAMVAAKAEWCEQILLEVLAEA